VLIGLFRHCCAISDLAAFKYRVHRVVEIASNDGEVLTDFLSKASDDLDRVMLLLQVVRPNARL
jgi:hypothetical protein